MAYLGNLTKAEFTALLQSEIKPLREELKIAQDKIEVLTAALEEQNRDILTVEQTIKYLNITPQSLRNWTKEGKLIKQQIGGRVYYLKSDIMKLLNKKPKKDGSI